MKTKAEIMRKYRLKKAIKEIVINNYETSYFLALTFNEETLKNTTKEQRLKLIKDYLNNQTDKYILNCDYGKKKGREHYHALTIAKDKYINFTIFNAYYGHIYARPINLNKNQSKESQIKYLLNHYLKESSERIIHYSKAKKPNHKPKNKKYIYTRQHKEKLETPINEYINKEKLLKENREEEHKKMIKYINNFLAFKRH